MSNRITACALAAALAAAAPLTARAEARASAQLSHFGWSLEDLRPDDGIAPTLGRAAATGNAALYLSVLEQGTRTPFPILDRSDDNRDFDHSFPGVQGVAALPHAAVTVAAGGDAPAHGYGALLQGHIDGGAQDDARSVFLQGSALLAASGWERAPFVLTPFTRLVWSGDVSLAASVSRRQEGGRWEWGATAFYAQMLDTADASPLGPPIDVILPVSNHDYRIPTAQRLDFPLQLEWVNDSAQPAAAWLELTMTVQAQNAPPSPVPEPGGWALWAAGLGVLGAVAARRRRLPRP